MANNTFDCCCHVLPEASLPEVVAGIVNYLHDHPGWSEAELTAALAPLTHRIEALEAKINTGG